MRENPFDPLSLSPDEFLTGPDGGELDIDQIFAKSFDRVRREILEFDSRSLDPDEEAGPETPSDIVEGYRFRPVRSGLILVAPDGSTVGGYIDCDVSIEPAHQGKGLGKELVLEYFMRTGLVPVWGHDRAAYSPAGAAAHAGARRLARDRALFARKAQRLACPDPDEPSPVPAAG